jgi:predicted ATPase
MPETPLAPDELSRLLSALAAKRTLLVLDNCEHLVAAAATLADRVWPPARRSASWPPAANP